MKDAKGHGSNPRGTHASAIDAAVPPKMTRAEFQALVRKSRDDSAMVDRITDKVIAAGTGEFNHPSGKMMLVSGSFADKTGLRATSFGADGEALGHREYPSYDKQGLRSEISMALSGGFKLKDE